MDVERLNIYKRLRDFKVPSTVLDNIFSEENDVKILENAFRALVEDGFKEDDAAKEILKAFRHHKVEHKMSNTFFRTNPLEGLQSSLIHSLCWPE